MSKTPSTRKTITLPDIIWAAVSRFKDRDQILTGTEAMDRLLRDGLAANGIKVPGHIIKRSGA